MTQDEIDLAARVHYGFLPEAFSNDTLDIAVNNRPFSRIGGDYCSIFQIDAGRVIVCMSDVRGHNVASALLAARVNTFVLTHVMDVMHPCDLIEPLNKFLCNNFSDNVMYTSFYSMIFHLDTMQIDFAGAGHPPAIHYRAGAHDCARLESETTPLGIEHPLPMYCSVNSISIDKGDRLLLYTDGLIDILDAQARQFTERGLEKFARQHHLLDAQAFGKQLFDEVVNAEQHTIRDDILLMNIGIKEGIDTTGQ